MDSFDLIEPVASVQHGVVTAAQCRQRGLSQSQVDTMCRTRRWIRLHEGIYYAYGENASGSPPRLALIVAAMMSAGPHAVAALGTAAEILGIDGLTRSDAIHLTLPGRAARCRRLRDSNLNFHQMVLNVADTTVVRGIRTTNAARTVADVMLSTDRLTAVGVLDSSLNRRILREDDLDQVRRLMRGRRGASTARLWVAEADARAESPLETRVRLRAADGGLPPDELQYRVRRPDGSVVAIADLAWTRRRVVGEADGVSAHDTPSALFRDRRRQNEIIAAGFMPIRFTWADTMAPAYVPAAVRAAMERPPASSIMD
jgi:very-short-patch-repair endonuclease